MPVIEGAKLKVSRCLEASCEGNLKLVESPSHTKHFLKCDTCDFIDEAFQRNDGYWIPKPRSSKRITMLSCLKCGRYLIEHAKDDAIFCTCSDPKCKFVVFAAERDIIGKCDCKRGYRYKDTTRKGKKVLKCNNKGCDYFAFQNPVKSDETDGNYANKGEGLDDKGVSAYA